MRMRTLKYAILGMVNQKPMTGYDLMQEFESTLNEFWSAKHSQIYPELKKLTEEGDMEFEVVHQDTAPDKKLYHITEEGRRDFLAWLRKTEDMAATPKDVFRLRLFFASEMQPEDRENLIQEHLLQHKLRLNHLKNNQKKFTAVPSSKEETWGDYVVLMGAIMREENTIQWLEKCLEMM